MDPPQPANEIKTSPKNNKMTLSLDLRIIVLLLLAIIIAMLFMWKPWVANADAKNRTVAVTGETTVKAVPDEFVFSPTYDFKNKDKAAALAQLTQKSDEIIKKLKSLGVAEEKIKSNSDGYDYNYYYDRASSQSTYSLRLTVTADDKKTAQKVQDYLITTSPEGNISPQANFSDKLQKQLENQARDEAAKDARAKAERTAKNLGFSLGKVKNISDSSDASSPILFDDRSSNELSAGAADSKPSLQVQPGQNDLPYSITVVYYVTD